MNVHRNNDDRILSRHQSALVVGLGVTGLSVVRYLIAQGLNVCVVDQSENPALAPTLSKQFPQVKTVFGGSRASLEKMPETMGLVVPSPGVSLRSPLLLDAANQGAEIVGDIELFVQDNTAPVIAITGSNGKSTVTSLVGEMCDAAGLKSLVAGNIGLPVLDSFVDGCEYDIVILELSSFQLETTQKLNASAATILNISADHMDRYASMGDYILAKARILRGAKHIVLPKYGLGLEQIVKLNHTLSIGLDEPANDSEFGVVGSGQRRWLAKGSKRLMPLADVAMVGAHNITNVLSAFALLDHLNLPLSALTRAASRFSGLPHRLQKIREADGVCWVNDSKATNVGATLSALRSLSGNLIWLAGGQGKDADFSSLKTALPANVVALIAFGEDADQLMRNTPSELNKTQVNTLDQAVTHAGEQIKHARTQQPPTRLTVLLSPACASFDQFDNFEHRGRVFEDLVNQQHQHRDQHQHRGRYEH